MPADPKRNPWRIPLSDLNYDGAERDAVAEVLESRWLTMGPRTEEFEARFAGYVGARHAVAVANCTCGLELAYAHALCRAAGMHGGAPDPFGFIVPDVTFVATANAALTSGAHAILTDISGASRPVLDPDAVARNLHEHGGRVAAIVPVHYAGYDAGVDELVRMARRHNTLVIEDAAHAVGGRTAQGRMLGAAADIGVFSFFSNKNLATGEGGMVVTDDGDLAAALRRARSHGMTSLTYERHAARRHGYDVVAAGHNYRCTEITAALGLVQLAKLDAGNRRRRELVAAYRSLLAGTDGVTIPFSPAEDELAACHILPLVCRTQNLRDSIRAALDAAGIQTSHHYPAIHTLGAYRRLAGDDDGLAADPCPRATDYAARQITLPLHPGLGDGAVEEICGVVARVAAD